MHRTTCRVSAKAENSTVIFVGRKIFTFFELVTGAQAKAYATNGEKNDVVSCGEH